MRMGTKMRKRIVTPTSTTAHAQDAWLDLERAATVEVTSEDKDFPIESSLSIVPRQGWRAAQPGTQTLRLIFDEPSRAQTNLAGLRVGKQYDAYTKICFT